MNAWTDKLTRVVRELLVAVIRCDWQAAKRTWKRVWDRIIPRPYRDGPVMRYATNLVCGAAVATLLWLPMFVLALSGGRL